MSSKYIDTLRGKANLFQNDTFIAKVTYRIDRFQTMVENPGFPDIPGLLSAAGSINCKQKAIDTFFGPELFTLHLKDGKKINFYMKDSTRNIVVSGSIG